MTENKKTLAQRIDPLVAIPSIIFVVVFTSFVFINPVKAKQIFTGISAFTMNKAGALILAFAWVCFILCLWFAFGKYGNKKFGLPGDDKPEFSNKSWLAYFFSLSTSATMFYWASIEYADYLISPPFNLEPMSSEAFNFATAYGQFHWGPWMWGMFTALGICYGFMMHVQKKTDLRPSAACVNVIGEKNVNGVIGKAIDAMYVFTLVCALGTSLGVSTPLLAAIVSDILGIEATVTVSGLLILAWALSVTITIFTGLKRGMKIINDFRMYFAFVVLALILFLGPTSFILNNTIDSIGVQFQNLIRMATYTDPYGYSNNFPGNWTIFYVAWNVVYAVASGIYLARVSKGRTVRQFIIAIITFGSTGAMIFYWILGNFSMDVFVRGIVPVTDLYAAGQGYKAILMVWKELPLAAIVIPIFAVYAFVATWTTQQAYSYNVAMATETGVTADNEPSTKNRLLWTVLLHVYCFAVIFLGGMDTVKASSVISGLPAILVCSLIIISTMKDMKKIWGNEDVEAEVRWR